MLVGNQREPPVLPSPPASGASPGGRLEPSALFRKDSLPENRVGPELPGCDGTTTQDFSDGGEWVTALFDSKEPALSVSGWTCLEETPRDGTSHMWLDASLLRLIDQAPVRTTVVRIYRWNRPTVSIGKHQKSHQAVNVAACVDKQIPIVRRPTGGRAVLHDDEVTYAIISNDDRHFPLHNCGQLYLSIAETLRTGLERLGIKVNLVPEGGYSHDRGPLNRMKFPCFVTASRYELTSSGRKLAGSAQRRLKRSFLQHGSLPLRLNRELAALVLGVAPPLLARRAVSTSEAAGRDLSFTQVGQALIDAFAAAYDLGRTCHCSDSEDLLKMLFLPMSE